MRTIYLDAEFKCHFENDGTRKAVETDIFDGWSKTLVECYRYIPYGSSWIRSDGEIFHGEMVTPFVNSSILELVKKSYEENINELNDADNALRIIGVEVD